MTSYHVDTTFMLSLCLHTIQKQFARHLCGRKVGKELLEASRRKSGEAGDILSQPISSPKRAGGWPLGPTDANNMFNLTRDREVVIKTTRPASLVVYSGTKLQPERSYFT